ncbi:hypothetical protein EV182_002085 [Spiromyces aspiralis]|uniref:Uncharacterized protein n=1 Tax=Spiromyces aspiralis TaxID=68401 RepID=A0ACC1HM84_9FUNG|nr:hypothetical protein EV182_002085 [Spiromyces aspiralis]
MYHARHANGSAAAAAAHSASAVINNRDAINGTHGGYQHKPESKRKAKSKGNRNKDKQSLNHLLNFRLPPRQASVAYEPRRKVRDVDYSYQPYDKSSFVNANFRFVLKFDCDLKKYATDPDAKVDWNDVEQVVMPSHGSITCPICLCTPVAARLTTCGHVYCLACLLRYVWLSEPKTKWHKCPVCMESINSNEFRPVRLWQIHNLAKEAASHPASGEGSRGNTTHPPKVISMRLIKRSQSGLATMPRGDRFWDNYPQGDTALAECSGYSRLLPTTAHEDSFVYSRFVIASPGYMTHEYRRELRELHEDLDVNQPGSDDVIHVQSAINEISVQIDITKHLEATQQRQTSDRAVDPARDQAKGQETRSDTESGGDGLSADGTATEDFDDDYFYFYQPDDGQHIYLQPLDFRVLKENYGSYARMPNEISVKVQHLTESTMNEQVRKRFRYLNHIPYRCDITFIEIDIKAVVSPETYAKYSESIEKRASQHAREARKESTRAKRMEALHELKIRQSVLLQRERQGGKISSDASGQLAHLVAAGLLDIKDIDQINDPDLLSALDNVDALLPQSEIWPDRPGFDNSQDFPQLTTVTDTRNNDQAAAGPSNDASSTTLQYQGRRGLQEGLGLSAHIPMAPVWPRNGSYSYRGPTGTHSWFDSDDDGDYGMDTGALDERNDLHLGSKSKKNRRNKKVLINTNSRRKL